MLPVFYWKVVVSDNRYLEVLSYGSQWIKPEEVIDILLSEHVLRELKQREEALKYRIVAFQKAKEIQSEDDSELENANKQLKQTRSKVPMKEHVLYRAVSMLDSYFKGVHDNLRRDSQWFMRNDMVQDCADRGGCCSRACGCCSQRHQCHGGKGIGHCTTECWCCTIFRGFELSEDEKAEVSQKRFEKPTGAQQIAIFDKYGKLLFSPFANAAYPGSKQTDSGLDILTAQTVVVQNL